MVAHLTRVLGPSRLQLVEETVQEAMLRALQTWPYQGIPENPVAWLFRVARHCAIDAVRRERMASEKAEALVAELRVAAEGNPGERDFEEQLRDDELRMIFMCCHPAIPRDASVALSLKTVGGFSVREIARAFLADDQTIAQRLVRAKRQIRASGLTLEMPGGAELEKRLDLVLEVIYFIFNEGYAAPEGEDLIRHDVCQDAVRLGRLLAASRVATPRVHALVALMALQTARLPARTDAGGDLILLEGQDRSRWDQRAIALGFRHFELALEGDEGSEYHVQAAIAATYARSSGEDPVDWPVILRLYDQLWEMNRSPVVTLNRAVVVAKVHGAAEALAAIEPLGESAEMRRYYLFLAVRGHLLLELGRVRDAADNFRLALECRCSEPERRFLRRKLEECGRGASVAKETSHSNSG